MRLCHHVNTACLAVLVFTLQCSFAARDPSKPNIVFVLSDDQDAQMNSLSHMQAVQKHLVNEGTHFLHHYAHVSLCCPSRVSLWTGQHAHNTNITDVRPPNGGWPQIQRMGYWNKYLPVWLQNEGYNTYYAGKLYNGHSEDNYCADNKCAAGWTEADFLVEPSVYSYYNSSFQHNKGDNHQKARRVPGYSTDHITQYSLNYIDDAVKADKPFFVVAAPIAPHISIPHDGEKNIHFPIPKKEYENLFPNLTVPDAPNFNPANRSGVLHIWDLDRQNDSSVRYLHEYYRHRQRALQSVDDMVERIMSKLATEKLLDNTYIIYSTDNGYHVGQHRLQPGKKCGFETDINIPFIMRGPKMAKGKTTDLVTSHIDLAPTIFNLIGKPLRDDFDGQGLTFPLKTDADFARAKKERGEHVGVEYWGMWTQEGKHAHSKEAVQTYKVLRLISDEYNLMYSVWCTQNAHELYDMTTDKYQMTNLHPNAPSEPGSGGNAYNKGKRTLLGRPTEKVLDRLDALIVVHKACQGKECQDPWAQLHPGGAVKNLIQALDKTHDDRYAKIPAMNFKKCPHSSKYVPENETPSWDDIKSSMVAVEGRDQESWELWA